MSNDGKIILPPNVTSLIQPMDQGVLESMKRHIKGKFLFLKIMKGYTLSLTEVEVCEWLESDQHDVGYTHLTDDEIVSSIVQRSEDEDDDSDSDEATQ